jgi:hypothetical protein
MTAAAVVNGGPGYDLLVDVGYLIDGFTLDDSVKGLLDSTDYVLDGSTSFASVIDGTTSIRVKRGRQDSTDVFPVGSMNFVLDDTRAGGVFNPFDDSPSNPYYDQAQDVPGLAPGRAVKLLREDDLGNLEELFVGFVVNYDLNFALGGKTTVSVFCADNAYRLAQTVISAHTPTVQKAGDRINAILNRTEVNYPTGAARSIASGTVDLGDYAISQGTNVKAYFDSIMDTAERGRFFISRDGVLTTQNRIGTTLSNPSVVFSDAGTDTPYRDLSIAFDADDIVNRVTVTPVGGTTATANDTPSQTTYFIKALDISNSLLELQADATTLASYLLEPEPEARFTSVETAFVALTDTQRDAVAIVDIGDTIEITRTIPLGNSTTTITQELQVEGIEHAINVSTGHSVRFYTSPTTIVVELVLDTGILDQDVLG